MLAVSSSLVLFGISMWALFTLALFIFGSDFGRKRSAADAANSGNQGAGMAGGEGPRDLAPSATPSIVAPSSPSAAERRVAPGGKTGKGELAERLVLAGLYRRNASTYYYLGQATLAAGLMAVVGGLWFTGTVAPRIATLSSLVAGVCVVLFPSLFLEQRMKRRQLEIRRGLPDALDVLVISLEAGLSLPAALVRLSKELAVVHPLLAFELTIVQREIQLGNSTGVALRNFSVRFGIDELRNLAAVAIQAERYGASIVQALRTHAESLRIKRLQQAQERAQKAAVKLLIPTVLFIFPAVFVVILGPAAYDIYARLSETSAVSGGR
ncbi:MAG: type II secretion system F family protein [Planctomycetota bacterium]